VLEENFARRDRRASRVMIYPAAGTAGGTSAGCDRVAMVCPNGPEMPVMTPRHRDVIRRHAFRFIRSSSSALPPQIMRRLEETFDAPVIEAYGMTEAAHQVVSNPSPPRPERPARLESLPDPRSR